MLHKMMKCGHMSMGYYNGKPCCPICAPKEDAFIFMDTDIDLTGRKAKCIYCDSIRESSEDLPFFEYKPNEEYDSYYCGCRGWD